MGNSSSTDMVQSRLGNGKAGSHLERQKKAVESVKKLRDGVQQEKEGHEKVKEKQAMKHVWHEIEEDWNQNVVEPLKHWTGIAAIQECAKPKEHMEESDDEYEEVVEKPAKAQKPAIRTTRDKVRQMIAEEFENAS